MTNPLALAQTKGVCETLLEQYTCEQLSAVLTDMAAWKSRPQNQIVRYASFELCVVPTRLALTTSLVANFDGGAVQISLKCGKNFRTGEWNGDNSLSAHVSFKCLAPLAVTMMDFVQSELVRRFGEPRH